MSIIIKGIDAPKDCSDCIFLLNKDKRGIPLCMFGTFIEYFGKKPSNCPLVQLRSNSRLINAWELVSLLENNYGTTINRGRFEWLVGTMPAVFEENNSVVEDTNDS